MKASVKVNGKKAVIHGTAVRYGARSSGLRGVRRRRLPDQDPRVPPPAAHRPRRHLRRQGRPADLRPGLLLRPRGQEDPDHLTASRRRSPLRSRRVGAVALRSRRVGAVRPSGPVESAQIVPNLTAKWVNAAPSPAIPRRLGTSCGRSAPTRRAFQGDLRRLAVRGGRRGCRRRGRRARGCRRTSRTPGGCTDPSSRRTYVQDLAAVVALDADDPVAAQLEDVGVVGVAELVEAQLVAVPAQLEGRVAPEPQARHARRAARGATSLGRHGSTGVGRVVAEQHPGHPLGADARTWRWSAGRRRHVSRGPRTGWPGTRASNPCVRAGGVRRAPSGGVRARSRRTAAARWPSRPACRRRARRGGRWPGSRPSAAGRSPCSTPARPAPSRRCPGAALG